MAKPPHIDGERGYLTLFFSLSKLPARYRYTTCRYHIVIVPQYRQKAIFGTLRKDIGKILRELCNQMGIELVEGHAMPDHVHLCLSMPPKYIGVGGFYTAAVRQIHSWGGSRPSLSPL